MEGITEVAGKVIEKASTGEILVAVVVLMGAFGLAGLWIWKVSIPNAVAARDNERKMTEALAAVCPTIVEIHEFVAKSGRRTHSIVRAMRIIAAVVEKVSRVNPSIDIDGEMGEIRGCLSDSELN